MVQAKVRQVNFIHFIPLDVVAQRLKDVLLWSRTGDQLEHYPQNVFGTEVRLVRLGTYRTYPPCLS